MLTEKTEVLGENPSQCHFVHHTSQTELGLKLDLHVEKPATNRLSHDSSA